MNKTDSLRNLKGIGEKTEKLFGKIGVDDLNQLLHYYPRDYDCYETVVPIGKTIPDEKNAVLVHVKKSPSVRSYGSKSVTVLNAQDETGEMTVTWFHMPFLRGMLKPGTVYILRGKVTVKGKRITMEHPQMYTPAQYAKLEGSLQPVYGLTSGLSNQTISKAVRQLLEDTALSEEYLPDALRDTFSLCEINYAVDQIHFPSNRESLCSARRRLAFDEFFFFMLGLARLKEKTQEIENHFPMKAVWKTEEVIENLPYRLTKAQMRVWNEVECDLKGKTLMNRLIQGDVGSGKTILAMLAMIMAYENGFQSALMVPTEVLAEQHFKSLTKLLQENELEDVQPVLLRGSCTAKEKREIYEKIASGEAKMIVGTHALIQEKVNYCNLGLVITDEQHRFGVQQRTILARKGYPPNVLVMSATPIPRTLAIILYGDLDLSIVDELPAKRLPIKNCVVGTNYRETAYRFIEKEITAGHQAYVICPMVEPNEELNCENVTEYTEKIKKKLPKEIRVAALHGQMPSQKKNEIMKAFSEHEIDVLVSTTVVEVGVDVSNATVILIENAERFGLAQLHQLRGRVGRGDAQSYCIFMQGDGKEETSRRLSVLNSSNDGFKIAEEDLKQRGPGDLFGIRQSGLAGFQIADVFADVKELKQAGEAVNYVMELDAELDLPQHRALKQQLDLYMEYRDKIANL